MPKYDEYPEISSITDNDILLILDAETSTTKKVKALTLKSYLSGGTAAPASTKLTGTVFGLSPFYNNDPSSSFTSAFDGDVNTFYSSVYANGSYAGLDFGSSKTITKIRYYPRSDFGGGASRAIGGKFQISTNNLDYTDFGIITSASLNSWSEINFNTVINGRYFRYYSPNDGYGNIAEIEIFGY